MSEAVVEHDYIGLSEAPVVENSDMEANRENDYGLNIRATELRLGLPGSESPERVDPAFLSLKSSYGASGAKRGFCDAIRGGGSGCKWVFSGGSEAAQLSGEGSSPLSGGQILNDGKMSQLAKTAGPAKEKKAQGGGVPPASKAQVVGWPPIRSFRRITMSSQSQKNEDHSETKSGSKCMYVKVSMDGAPYLRKIDLNTYGSYIELSSALKRMFGCFTLDQRGGGPSRDGINENGLTDLLHSEYVLTYEDKDGDWMLVGDVPWKMFTETCRRLMIMKSSDAVGLAPRATEKSHSKN